MPLLLLGMRHARVLLESGQESPQAWTILGHCSWSLAPDLHNGPPDRLAAWDLATGLSWAQAAFCYRQALKQSSHNAPALLSLARLFEIRRMAQAQGAVAASVRAITNRPVTGGVQSLDELTRAFEATGVNLTWDEAEKRAVALLNLGAPVEARRLYERRPRPSIIRSATMPDRRRLPRRIHAPGCGASLPGIRGRRRSRRPELVRIVSDDARAGRSLRGPAGLSRSSEMHAEHTATKHPGEDGAPLARYSERTHQVGWSGWVHRTAQAAGIRLNWLTLLNWHDGNPLDR